MDKPANSLVELCFLSRSLAKASKTLGHAESGAALSRQRPNYPVLNVG